MDSDPDEYWSRALDAGIRLRETIREQEVPAALLGMLPLSDGLVRSIVPPDPVLELSHAGLRHEDTNPIVFVELGEKVAHAVVVAAHGRHDRASDVTIYLGPLPDLPANQRWLNNPVREDSATATLHGAGLIPYVEMAQEIAAGPARAGSVTIVPADGKADMVGFNTNCRMATGLALELRKQGATNIQLSDQYVTSESGKAELARIRPLVQPAPASATTGRRASFTLPGILRGRRRTQGK